jgi:ribosomal protein S18 acetylase RimI-like enzyme
METTIRAATSEDVEAIRQVARESWHATYDDIVGAERVESVVDSWYDRDGLAQSVAREDGRFLVAEAGGKTVGGDNKPSSRNGEAVDEDGEIVGFAQAVLGDEDEAAELPRIYVHPDHWNEGIGSELLDRIETWVREREAERLRLVVLADNEVGNAFYESHGYRAVGSRESELEGETYADYVREKEL